MTRVDVGPPRRLSSALMLSITLLVAVVEVRAASAADAGSARGEDARVLGKLQLLFGTADEPTRVETAHLGRADIYRTFIREQMQHAEFYENVLALIINIDRVPAQQPLPLTLRKLDTEGEPFYYLDQPCATDQRVPVRPWWNLATTVWICSAAYHPEITVDRRANAEQYCEATDNASGEPVCRCGAYLLNCAKDRAQQQRILRAWREEYVRTLQHVVQTDRPFSDVLTMNETMRSSYAEFFYARNRYFETGALSIDLSDAGRSVKLRPRISRYGAAQFAGVLTIPQLRYREAAPRLLISDVWHDFLCSNGVSAAVDAHTLVSLGLGEPQLRQKELMQLTTQLGCQDCHARLEYGMRAFDAYLTSRYGMRIVDNEGAGRTTKFYVRGADDVRGEGPATPLWVGEMIARQPEFYECMTRRVEELFYGRERVPAAVHQQLRSNFETNRSMGWLIEQTLVGRYAGVQTPLARGAP